jgi:radical SAM superfamily enzyme YgiQ (UPF0313 family)
VALAVKIGLIAISGVRVRNEELLEVGLTLPGFVRRGEIIASLPSLGLLTLAGMTPDEFHVEYREVPDVGALTELPGEFDLAAISSYTAQMREAYDLADCYRKAGTAVVLGGLHVTAVPEEAALHADAIVIGEGEPSWPSLLEDFRHGRLRPRYDSRTTDFSLEDAPMPRFELLDRDRYNRLTVQTQRGCPHRCEFCAASVTLSPAYKVKPVERVIAEVRRIKEIWRKPFIEFADDNTFVDKKHGKKLMRALAPERVRWFTETDVSVADDDELLASIRDAGCAQLLIGLESPSPEGLDGLEIRSNWKARQLDRYAAAVDRIQGHGISVNGCFVLGLDGTGPESFDEVVQFARATGFHEVQVTIQTPFPGTPLYDRLKRSGRLLDEDAWETCTLFDVNFEPDRMSVPGLETGFRRLVAEIYAEPLVAERKRKFRTRLRSLRNRERRERRRDNGRSKVD